MREIDSPDRRIPRATAGLAGCYVYGVVPMDRPIALPGPGINNTRVYTIPFTDIGAVVHDCPAEPYSAWDMKLVREWVKSHQGVLDEARALFDTVIPFGFDTIIRGADGGPAGAAVADWLSADYPRLKALLERMRGKDEYGLQIFYDPAVIGVRLMAQEDLKSVRSQIEVMSPGLAYLYRRRLETMLRAEMGCLADGWFQDMYRRVRPLCVEVVFDKIKKMGKDKVMLLNLSCLVARESVNELGEELDMINRLEGFSVHFSGPWPPYTFVGRTSPALERSQA